MKVSADKFACAQVLSFLFPFTVLLTFFIFPPFVCLSYSCQQQRNMAIPTGFWSFLACFLTESSSSTHHHTVCVYNNKFARTSKIIYERSCLKTDIEYYANFHYILNIFFVCLLHLCENFFLICGFSL